MHGAQAERPSSSAADEPADRLGPWIGDCWLIEVMPPTWTWAYSRLLSVGETRPGFSDRIA